MSAKKQSFTPIDLNRLRTYSIFRRKNLVSVKQFARLTDPPKGFAKFLDSLPDILAGRALNRLINTIVKAYRDSRLIGVGLGAHVIKCGLSPVIIDLMNRGIIKALALNGASAIHDYEISLIGATSEDVKESIKTGKFGMAKETAYGMARAAQYAMDNNIGLGQALGNLIREERNKFADYSILAAAAKLKIPVSVHVAIGTDTVHMHPVTSGETLGAATLFDFRLLASVIGHLNKGIWLNIGSAVILPEVFIKAVSMARNLGHRLNDFTTANLDMIQHYRPNMNVTGRPTTRGINIIGHHEIMLPLLRWGILSSLKQRKRRK